MKNHCRFCSFSSFLFLVAIFVLSGCKTSPPTAPVDAAPTATITSHSNGDIIYAIDTIVVAATDDRKVTKVEMYLNGQRAATDSVAPWKFIWDTEQWNDGSYTLQAKAYDEPGHVGTSPVVTVTTRNAPPTASITSPVSNEICSGIDTIVVSAVGANTLTKVELYVNATLAATANAAPWKFIWDTRQSSDGSYSLQAVSYDVAQHHGVSNAVSVIVGNTPPTTTITSPSANATVSGTVTVLVSAVSAITITKVELYVNGTLSATDNSSPWSFSWNTQQAADGAYTLQAKAYDVAGHVGTSASISVTVSNTAAFSAKFVNTVYTPMSITVQGVTRTVQPDDSTTFAFTSNPQSLVYDASTSGATSGGTQIGKKLTWGGSSNPINVSGYTSVRLSLQASSTNFFMFMTNTGKTTLGPIYVNYGLSDQTRDNISIPGDGVTYSIGYYNAHTNTVVRAYWSYPTTSYSLWTPSFPFTVNQAVNFTNTYPLTKVDGVNAGNLEGALGIAKIQLASAGRGQKIDVSSHGNTFVIPSND
jgi:hypothetical protein